MNTKPAFHGSDIEKICEYYQLKKEDVINFAANVNPLGLSESLKETLAARLDILCAYPDRGYTGLRNVISDYCHIPPEFVLPGNGTSELISLLIGGCRTDFADIQNKKECGGNRQWQNHYLRNWAANTKGKGII